MSLIIYIAEKLFRTAHADVFLLEHHQKVCVSTICREKHVLKILPCAGKKKTKPTKRNQKKANMMQRFSVLFWNHEAVNSKTLLNYYLFIYLKDKC